MSKLLVSLLVVPLAACTSDDEPTIRFMLSSDGQVGNEPPSESLVVALERPYGYVFESAVTGKLNGRDLGHAALHEGQPAEDFRSADVPASASFRIPLETIERGVLVELTEGSEQFVVEVPDFNAPRAVNIHTSLAALRADDWIEVDSGVASDRLSGGFSGSLDGGFCFTHWATERRATSVAFKMPPAGTLMHCGTDNPPGSTRDIDLRIRLEAVTPTTRCEGPDVTCEPVFAPAVVKETRATLQF